MKLYRKKESFTQNLWAGLLIVSLLFVTGVLTGCGTEDKLLSELRQEDFGESDDWEDTEDIEESIAQGSSIKEISGGARSAAGKAVQDAGAETVQAKGQGASVEEIWKNEQSVSDERFQGTEQNAGTLKREALSETEKIYVHVCGAVKSPGVYELPAGSRFYEAVEAAGGFTEEACQDYLNMAASLADGSRLEIPTLEAVRDEAKKTDSGSNGDGRGTESGYYTLPVKESGGGSESAENASDKLVNINTADIAGLCNLPGIGEGRAKAIIEYREKHGGFRKKEDIMQVSGIGEKMYARMEDCLTVE